MYIYRLNENCTWGQVVPSTFQVNIVYLVPGANKSNKVKTHYTNVTSNFATDRIKTNNSTMAYLAILEKPVHSMKLTGRP